MLGVVCIETGHGALVPVTHQLQPRLGSENCLYARCTGSLTLSQNGNGVEICVLQFNVKDPFGRLTYIGGYFFEQQARVQTKADWHGIHTDLQIARARVARRRRSPLAYAPSPGTQVALVKWSFRLPNGVTIEQQCMCKR